jgi:hypothetical protein
MDHSFTIVGRDAPVAVKITVSPASRVVAASATHEGDQFYGLAPLEGLARAQELGYLINVMDNYEEREIHVFFSNHQLIRMYKVRK